MDQETLIKHNLQPLRIDAMPYEVATEYLTTPGLRTTAAWRRRLHAARASYYVSTNTPKTAEKKLSQRFSRWRIDRLTRQSKRTQKRIRMVQHQLDKTKVQRLYDQIMTGVMLPLIALGQAIQKELDRRTSRILSNA